MQESKEDKKEIVLLEEFKVDKDRMLELIQNLITYGYDSICEDEDMTEYDDAIKKFKELGISVDEAEKMLK